MSFKKIYLKNKMVLNFHLFLIFIYWVGATYSLYAYSSVLNIPFILPFLFLLFLIFLWILGTLSIFIELIVFVLGKECDGSIVDYEKKAKKLRPIIRFRKNDVYESYAFYREYFDPLDLKRVSVFYYRNWWSSPELSYLKI